MIVVKNVPFYVGSREWEVILKYKHDLKVVVADTGVPVVVGYGKLNGRKQILPELSRFDLYLDAGPDSGILMARHFNLHSYVDPATLLAEYYLTISARTWVSTARTRTLHERLVEQKLQSFLGE